MSEGDKAATLTSAFAGGTASTTSGPSGGGGGSHFDENFASSLEGPPDSGDTDTAATTASAAAGPYSSGLQNLDRYEYLYTTGDEAGSTFISLPSASSSVSLEDAINSNLDAHHFGTINPLGPIPRNRGITSRAIGPPAPDIDEIGGMTRTAVWMTTLPQGETYRTTLVMRIPPTGYLDAHPVTMTYERVQPTSTTERFIVTYRPDRSIDKQSREVIHPDGRTRVTVQRYDARDQPIGDEEIVRDDPPVAVVDFSVPPANEKNGEGAVSVTSDLTSRVTQSAAMTTSMMRAGNRGTFNQLGHHTEYGNNGADAASDDTGTTVPRAFIPPPATTATATAAMTDDQSPSNGPADNPRRKRNKQTCAIGALIVAVVALAAGLGIALSSGGGEEGDSPPSPTAQTQSDPNDAVDVYPAVASPTSSQHQPPPAVPCSLSGLNRLVAKDAATGDRLGYSVAATDDAIVVGAPEITDGNGLAYVYSRTGEGGRWEQNAKLTASDAEAGEWDEFGHSVAISVNTIVVGSPNKDDIDKGIRSGSAYVFSRSAEGGTWKQTAKLVAADGYAGQQFGYSVAISVNGNTIIVGAIRNFDEPVNKGAAYVYSRDGEGGTWEQITKLTASDGKEWDWFGADVAISGDTIVIGTTKSSTYVFSGTRRGRTWEQIEKLEVNSDDDLSGWKGQSVAVTDDTIVVGGYHYLTGIGSPRGAAYVYSRTSGGQTWEQVAKLALSDEPSIDRFGWSVAISGSTIVVGSPGFLSGYFGGSDAADEAFPGKAYIFSRKDGEGTWGQTAVVEVSGDSRDDRFGVSVDISGNTIVVGDEEYDHNGLEDSGAAFVGKLPC